MVERHVWDVDVVGSNPATPIFVRIKPFGERVEGLILFIDESYAVEPKVQTHDLEQSAFGAPCSIQVRTV